MTTFDENPIAKAIAETDGLVAQVKLDVKERRQWASVRLDHLLTWSRSQDVTARDEIARLEPLARPIPPPTSGELWLFRSRVTLSAVLGVAAVVEIVLHEWIWFAFAIVLIASSFAFLVRHGRRLAAKTRPTPAAPDQVKTATWLAQLFFEKPKAEPAFLGRDAAGNTIVALWVGKRPHNPPTDTPEF